MKNLLFTMSFLCLSTAVYAEDCTPNKSLVQFTSQGKSVPSTQVGQENICEDFGGNQVFTPKHNVLVYVNYNIKGSVNLDQIDAAFESGLRFQNTVSGRRLLKAKLVVVRDGWIKKTYDLDEDICTSLNGDMIFISQKVLESGNFEEVIRNVYSITEDSQST